MRSRAESLSPAWRRGAEWLCRFGALALLGWCLWASAFVGRRSVVPADGDGSRPSSGSSTSGALTAEGRLPTGDAHTLDTATANRELAAWTRDADLGALHLSLTSVPDGRTRDWLRALDGAGTRISWSGAIPAVAVAAEPVADPRGGVRVSVAAPNGAVVRVADAVGRIDTLVAAQGGGSVRAATVVGAVHASSGGVVARTRPSGARMLRDVVVLGSAGWETKFVAAALEEQGWTVTVRIPIAPGVAVGGGALGLDTARVSAVIALDTAAAGHAAAVIRFARAGGGVVLGPEAARLPALAPIAVGRAGATLATATSYAAAIAPVTRQTLAIAPIAALRADAVALERRDGNVVLAARRVEAGRVVQLGYDETWRWRMAGGDDAPAAHRRWWSELVASVAYAPAAGGVAANDAAPRAALVAALGEASPIPSDGTGTDVPFDPSRSILVYLAIAGLLLLEWASRRLRGAA